MKRIGLTFVVLIAIMFLVYFAGRGTRVSDARAENRSQINPPSGGRDFTLKDLEGHDESLGQFEGKSAVAPFMQQERFKLGTDSQPVNYPILIGNDDVAEKFGGLVGLPTTILISQDGRQVKRIDGLLSYDEVDKTIQSLLETGAR